ncbi:MAG: DUF2817 domain-containing protein, partial [Nitrospinaceae bacterium]|nr:M14 family metallocarboxypeptidase [Nitrospinaceae bacterium]NIR55685.1 M14 family metallocarboxypeptidase [Nitrospinaceae bacterium]NIS86129.1 M14 family metallocarboxypeptidase [Nitrospinaceae bacterium]NIT82973.1 M14 family metallocarboxypeptidase [Nitrospinaceae bacterium]NIU45176.1 M14 family metallocarboxypeptidase [Nitrospinaceae bacterium]
MPAPHSEYPLCAVSLARGGSHRVLISAGIHGDEPAGVEALCHFLERREYRSFLRHWEIVLIPCINP